MKINKLVIILLGGSLLCFSLGQLARISIPDQPVFFYLYELLVGFVTTILVFRYRLKPFQNQMVKPISMFFTWLLISFIISIWFYSMNHDLIAFLYFLRLLLYYVFFIYLVYFFQKERVQKSFFMVNLTSIAIILTSFVQYFLYQNLGNLAYLGWDPHLYRVVGLFFDPPITVSVYVIFAIYFFLYFEKSRNWGYLLLITPLLVLSFLTYSRGGLLGLVALCVVYVLKKQNWRLLVFVVFILVGGFLVIPKGSSEGINLLRTTSIEARINDYEKAITIWKKSPIVGIGYNHIRYEKDEYEEQVFYGPYNPSHGSTAFHSSFLVILVTSGVIGLILYLWMLFSFAKMSEFMLLCIVFLSIVSIFDNVLLHPFLLYLVFLLEGYTRTWKKG